MFWLIQNAKFQEHGVKAIYDYILEKGLDHKLVMTPAFTDLILDGATDISKLDFDINNVPEIELPSDTPVMTIGSYSLAKAAIKKGWKPGAFINDNFTFSRWVSGWGKDNLLNGHAIEAPIKDIVVPENMEKLFARPSEDTKSFSGQVFERKNFIYWLNKIINAEFNDEFTKDTSIIFSPVVEIECEFRLFVVDGKIVTGSLYKSKDRVLYSQHVDKSALDFANEMIKIWQPDRAFALDVALTPSGPKIIEINNINSAGFYAADLPKFVDAIEKMVF